MTMTAKEREAFMQEVEQQILAKLARKKQTESEWREARSRMRDKVQLEKFANPYWVVDHAAALAKEIWKVYGTNTFTAEDCDTIFTMLDEIITVARKYKKAG